MQEDKIKEAFVKAKQDILDLKNQIISISQELNEIKSLLTTDRQTNRQTDVEKTTANNQNPTHNLNEPQNLPLNSLKTPILPISTGNRGVPADRQTNQQTDNTSYPDQNIQNTSQDKENTSQNQLINVSEILSSLDSIKSEVRLKFKHLTKQEFLIFSTIYQLEGTVPVVDYSVLSKKLNLTESSIRDYIQRIIKKGIPIVKNKENNKKILLSISPDLKKIASLTSLIRLREL